MITTIRYLKARSKMLCGKIALRYSLLRYLRTRLQKTSTQMIEKRRYSKLFGRKVLC
jgi:hypothetical protein